MNRTLVAALAWVLTVLALQGCSASFSAVDASSGAGTGASSTGTTQGSASTNFGSATPPRFGPQMP